MLTFLLPVLLIAPLVALILVGLYGMYRPRKK
jgi:nitrate reductase NapE component